MSVFDRGNETYKSNLILGKKYRDNGTGLEGTLVCIAFFEYACERGTLRYLDANRQLQDASFDAPELVLVESKQEVRVYTERNRPGGPERGGTSRQSSAQRKN